MYVKLKQLYINNQYKILIQLVAFVV